MNELIFVAHCFIISCACLAALYAGKQALTTLVTVYCILANILVIKQITLFGINATTADAFTIGAVITINFINEWYGKNNANRALYIAFASSLLVTVLTQIHLWYLPSCFDTSNQHFCAIFNNTPRIIAASLIAYLIAQTLENRLYAFLKNAFHGDYIIMRNWLTIGLTQLVDTTLFSFLGLYGIVEHIGAVLILSYCIKIASLVLISPAIMAGKKIKNAYL